ncbi:MAG: MATE family efflux transporter, partial [Flavobacteriales bacterium]
AFATVVAEFIGTGFLVSFTFMVGYGKTYGLFKSLFNKPFEKSKAIFKLSIPLMFQQVLALATWTLFFFMVEKIGGTALKVSNVIRSFYMLAFVIVMGVGQTTRTYVSSLIAEKRQADLKSTLWKLIAINLIGISLLCHGFVLYPEFITSFFFDDPAKGIHLIKSLRVIFLSVVIFSFGSVWLNAIEGSGKTKIALSAEVISIAVYLCLVYQLTMVHPQPIHVVWMSDYLYFGCLAGLSGLYLAVGNWKHNTI